MTIAHCPGPEQGGHGLALGAWHVTLGPVFFAMYYRLRVGCVGHRLPAIGCR